MIVRSPRLSGWKSHLVLPADLQDFLHERRNSQALPDWQTDMICRYPQDADTGPQEPGTADRIGQYLLWQAIFRRVRDPTDTVNRICVKRSTRHPPAEVIQAKRVTRGRRTRSAARHLIAGPEPGPERQALDRHRGCMA